MTVRHRWTKNHSRPISTFSSTSTSPLQHIWIRNTSFDVFAGVGCSICIFLENDNFQKQTEHLVQRLYRSTNDMFGKMKEIKARIDQQEGQLSGVSTQIVEVTRMQKLVEEGVSRGIQEVVDLQRSTAHLEEQMNASLQIEVTSTLHACLLAMLFLHRPCSTIVSCSCWKDMRHMRPWRRLGH